MEAPPGADLADEKSIPAFAYAEFIHPADGRAVRLKHRFVAPNGARVDNATAVAPRPPGALARLQEVAAVADKKGLSLRPPEVGKIAESLGLVLDLEALELRHTQARF